MGQEVGDFTTSQNCYRALGSSSTTYRMASGYKGDGGPVLLIVGGNSLLRMLGSQLSRLGPYEGED